MAPSAGDGRKAISASIMRRTPQAGCHNSGWKALKDKHIFFLISNLPDGVKNIMCGGLNGYSGGSFKKNKVSGKMRFPLFSYTKRRIEFSPKFFHGRYPLQNLFYEVHE
mmetsp:Transcript_42180/g.47948  ORF Transcript_42180/g.47948 Transcript_42180/m.47948 type:complete len:109 (-) Transcript_42180:169-495(-)